MPARRSRYTPDFPLANGIILETKGRFLSADRQKHKWIKSQHPDLDIRFVFSSAKSKLNKRSTTTYADWCESYGFKWADKMVPLDWLSESPCPVRLAAIQKATQ